MKGLFFVLVAAAAIGCASAPKRSEPDIDIDVPKDWTSVAAPAGSTTDTTWWNRFGDERLNEIVLEVLERNYDLQAAAARLDAAAAQAMIAGADLWPHLNAEGSATRAKQNFIGFPVGGGNAGVVSTTSTTLGVGLGMSWEIDLWGRIRAGQSAALADVQASQAQLAATHLSLSGQAAKTWFSLAEAKRQVELSEETIRTFQRTADQVRERFERGIRSSLDLRLALTDLAASKALLELRKRQFELLRRQLEILMGRYPAGMLEGTDVLPNIPPPVPTGLPAELVSRRPDVITAERRLAAADKRIKEAKASLYPRISLTGSAGTRSSELGDLLDGDFSVWNLVGNLFQPIFQGGRLRAGVDLARANTNTALAVYAQTVLRAFSEVEIALASEEYLRQQEAYLVTAADQARAAQDLADERYRSGLADIVTVLAAQRRALETESSLLAVRRDRLNNRVDLHLALGGGFDFDSITGPPLPEERTADGEPGREPGESEGDQS